MTPRVLFRTFATAEAITWAGLITALILRATDVTDAAVSIAGGLHGFVFLTYCATTILVWVDQRWPARTGVLGLVLAIVPFATVPFEFSVDRRGLLGRSWRLRSVDGERPRGFVEHTAQWVLRHPLLALVLILLLLVAVFMTLLWLGPPIPKS